jgi:hypothetical protein
MYFNSQISLLSSNASIMASSAAIRHLPFHHIGTYIPYRYSTGGTNVASIILMASVSVFCYRICATLSPEQNKWQRTGMYMPSGLTPTVPLRQRILCTSYILPKDKMCVPDPSRASPQTPSLTRTI